MLCIRCAPAVPEPEDFPVVPVRVDHGIRHFAYDGYIIVQYFLLERYTFLDLPPDPGQRYVPIIFFVLHADSSI